MESYMLLQSTQFPNDIKLRKLDEKEDIDLLFTIYASTREEIIFYEQWSPQQKEDFLNNQFWLQHNAYMNNYDNPFYYVIRYKEADVGRLYLDTGENELRIIDIALLPHARGVGVATTLLSEVIDLAKKDRKKVSIHVEKQNRAKNLYHRLGFTCIEEGSVYDLMEKPL